MFQLLSLHEMANSLNNSTVGLMMLKLKFMVEINGTDITFYGLARIFTTTELNHDLNNKAVSNTDELMAEWV